MTKKVSMILIAMGLALSSPFAMAQSRSHSYHGAAGPAFRSAMNSMHRHRHHGWSASRYNGHGINDLGVTTNQGRKYNGG